MNTDNLGKVLASIEDRSNLFSMSSNGICIMGHARRLIDRNANWVSTSEVLEWLGLTEDQYREISYWESLCSMDVPIPDRQQAIHYLKVLIDGGNFRTWAHVLYPDA
jgi:hypothetical protein